MLVVSNTSPILNLAIIDRLSLIREQFTTVIIPKGVLEELRVGENLPGSIYRDVRAERAYFIETGKFQPPR